MDTETEIIYDLLELRREKTGLHGMLAISNRGTPLGFTECNIKRDRDRRELVRWSHGRMSSADQAAYPVEDMYTDIDRVCLWTIANWEISQVELKQYAGDTAIPPIEFLLKPFIAIGAGTIMFGPPESGKSYLLLTMAHCIASGLGTLWDTAPAPVLVLNLERPEKSIESRDIAIRKCLSVAGNLVTYVHAVGTRLTALEPRLRHWAKENPGGHIAVDSISRSGMGALTDDVTAMDVVNLLNRTGASWMAIAHTPRADNTHIFGSMHFEAGADITLRVSSTRQDDNLGVLLQVDKANDMKRPLPEYMTFEFAPDNSGLVAIRKAHANEYAELKGEVKRPAGQRIREYTMGVPGGESTPGQTSDALGIARQTVSDIYRGGGYSPRRNGKEIYYRVIHPEEHVR